MSNGNIPGGPQPTDENLLAAMTQFADSLDQHGADPFWYLNEMSQETGGGAFYNYDPDTNEVITRHEGETTRTAATDDQGRYYTGHHAQDPSGGGGFPVYSTQEQIRGFPGYEYKPTLQGQHGDLEGTDYGDYIEGTHTFGMEDTGGWGMVNPNAVVGGTTTPPTFYKRHADGSLDDDLVSSGWRPSRERYQDLLQTIVGDSSVGMYGANPQHMRGQRTAASQSWQDYMNNWLGKNTVGGKGLPRINRRNVAGQGYSDQFSNPYSEDTYTPGSDVLTNYGAYDYGETLGDEMLRVYEGTQPQYYPAPQNPQP